MITAEQIIANGWVMPIAITVLSIVAIILSVPVFVAYRLVCRYVSGVKPGRLLKASVFSGKKLLLVLIAIISIIILNILFYKFGYGGQLLIAAVFSYLLLILAAVDFETQMLPDIITKPLIALGLLQGYFEVFTNFKDAALGAFAGYFILWGVNTCFRMVRGIDGMGYGDFKLLAAIGAWTGIIMLPLTILLSSIIGIFVAISIIKLTNQDIKAPTPFGPTLVFTGFIVFTFGHDILGWYLNLLQAS